MYLLLDPSRRDAVRAMCLSEAGECIAVNEGGGDLLAMVDGLLRDLCKTACDVRGVGVVIGAGRFTDTRRAAVVGNALASVFGIPVAGIRQEEMNNPAAIAAHLATQPCGVYLSPAYSGEPNVTLKAGNAGNAGKA